MVLNRTTGHRLSTGVEPADADLTWHVLRTATNRAAKAEEALVEAGFAVYLPRLIRWGRAGPLKVRVEKPLFPGYLFVGLNQSQGLYAALASDFVHNVLRPASDRDPYAIPFAEIAEVLQAELAGEFDKTRRARKLPEAGEPIDIIGGQYKGFPAKFSELVMDEKHERERVKVLFRMLGKWNELTLKPNQVALPPDEEDAA
jgi:transcriptional antiterminator RfaH